MTADQPFNRDELDSHLDKTNTGPESGNEEVNALKNLIDSKNTGEINNNLDDNFLENLKDGLHPDTAKELKDTIEKIEGFNEENTDLNRLYNYVCSICDAFDTKGNEEDDHEIIQTKFDVNEFVDEKVKAGILRAVNFVEYKNIIIGDEKISSILSATKGILNGGELSGGIIVKMAEFLGVSTKENDEKYNRQGRLNRLGKKIFSMDNNNGLFKWLSNKYESMTKDSEEMKSFLKNPLKKMLLIMPDWKGGEISKDNEAVTKFCNVWRLSVEEFVNSFNEKNTERINQNKEGLKKIDITAKFDINKAEIDEKGTLRYDQDGIKVLLNADKLVSLVTIQESDVEGGNFVSNEDLQNTIKDNSNPENSVTQARLNHINKVVGERASEPTPESESEQETQIDSLESKDDITISLRYGVKAEDIFDILSGLDEEARTTKAERINEVIEALQNNERLPNSSGNQSIQTLQNKMNTALIAEGKMTKKLVPDGKFGPKTLHALKLYLGAKITRGETLIYDKGGTLSGVQRQIAELIDTEGNEEALGRFGIYAAEGEDVNEVALNLLDKSKRRDYLKVYIDSIAAPFPGRKTINEVIEATGENKTNSLKSLQLSLVPYYNGQIDGIIGSKTLTAIENYIKDTKNASITNSEQKKVINEESVKLPGEQQNKIKTLQDGTNGSAVITNNHAYFLGTDNIGKDFAYSCSTNNGTTTLSVTIDEQEYTTTNGTIFNPAPSVDKINHRYLKTIWDNKFTS